jgi:hypothetical protein
MQRIVKKRAPIAVGSSAASTVLGVGDEYSTQVSFYSIPPTYEKEELGFSWFLDVTCGGFFK